MQIITQIPPSGTAVRDALIREIKTGFQLQREREQKDELEAARQAKELRGHREIKGLGRCVMQIPSESYALLQRRYGHEEVHSKEFIKFFQKKYPELSPHKL